MVQTDISQLSRECNQWRERLHSYRDEFNQLKSKLQQAVNKSLSKDQRTDLEHYQNQLHIQLINIHDLKHSIKTHEKRIEQESASGDIAEDNYTLHEELLNEFLSLENTLQEVRNEFKTFISATSC